MKYFSHAAHAISPVDEQIDTNEDTLFQERLHNLKAKYPTFNLELAKAFSVANLIQANDIYDSLGRNISAHERRQMLIPRTLIDRQRVPNDSPHPIKHSP